MTTRRRSTGGFTLVELMVVVAVIGIISAFALPGFLKSRIAGNEASAISTMRTLVSVNEQYKVRFGEYADALSDLYAEGYIDSSVANPFKAGYSFTYNGAVESYEFFGSPTNPGVSGERHFFVDSSGVIRFSTTGAASSTDSALSY